MTTNLFVTANVKQLRTKVVLEFYFPFRTSWCVGVLNSVIFNSFDNRGDFGTILEGLRNFGGGLTPQTLPHSVRHWTLLTRLVTISFLRKILSKSVHRKAEPAPTAVTGLHITQSRHLDTCKCIHSTSAGRHYLLFGSWALQTVVVTARAYEILFNTERFLFCGVNYKEEILWKVSKSVVANLEVGSRCFNSVHNNCPGKILSRD